MSLIIKIDISIQNIVNEQFNYFRYIGANQGKDMDLVNVYINYINGLVRNNADRVEVISDGFRSSTKDHEHARRLKNLSRNIEATENKKVMISRTKFLDNINNKDNLIKLIVRECNKTKIQAEQEEADTTLVQRAISLNGYSKYKREPGPRST